MLKGVGIAAVVALVAAPLAGGGTPAATAVLSSDLHGARPVALTIRLHAELQCGQLRSTSVTVSLPAAMHVPSSVPKTAVAVAGKAPATVSTSGSRVLVHPAAPKPGAICNVIGPGVVAITFTQFAGLGNPLHAGSYTFGVVAKPSGGEWHGVLAIR